MEPDAPGGHVLESEGLHTARCARARQHLGVADSRRGAIRTPEAPGRGPARVGGGLEAPPDLVPADLGAGLAGPSRPPRSRAPVRRGIRPAPALRGRAPSVRRPSPSRATDALPGPSAALTSERSAHRSRRGRAWALGMVPTRRPRPRRRPRAGRRRPARRRCGVCRPGLAWPVDRRARTCIRSNSNLSISISCTNAGRAQASHLAGARDGALLPEAARGLGYTQSAISQHSGRSNERPGFSWSSAEPARSP